MIPQDVPTHLNAGVLLLDLEQMEKQNVSVSIDADGQMFFNGRPVAAAATIEAGVAGFLAGKKEPKDRLVVFRCDKGVDKQVFEPVLAAISKAGGVIAAVDAVLDRGADIDAAIAGLLSRPVKAELDMF